MPQHRLWEPGADLQLIQTPQATAAAPASPISWATTQRPQPCWLHTSGAITGEQAGIQSWRSHLQGQHLLDWSFTAKTSKSLGSFTGTVLIFFFPWLHNIWHEISRLNIFKRTEKVTGEVVWCLWEWEGDSSSLVRKSTVVLWEMHKILSPFSCKQCHLLPPSNAPMLTALPCSQPRYNPQ